MRIIHLPQEVAGQIAVTVKAQKTLGHQAAGMAHLNPFYPPLDFHLERRPGRFAEVVARTCSFTRIAESFDAFHYHAGNTLLPRMADARYMKWRGKRIVTEFWGSDVRLPEVETARNPYYVNGHGESDRINRERMARWAELTDGEAIFSDHTFTVFLQEYFSRIHLVGQRIDVTAYRPHYPDPETKRVRVVHAPSQQAFKGTVFVENAIQALRAKGLDFDYVRVEGMAHAEAIRLYETADLIIDQVCGGSHGVFACEAMALGKPVICYILPDLIAGFPDGFPLINANPDTLKAVLEEWILSPDRRHAVGRQGRAYVERYHDVGPIAENLVRIYRRDFDFSGQSVLDWRGRRD